MTNPKAIPFLPIVLFLIISVNFLQAQYIIEQVEYKIPFSYELIPENTEFNSAKDEGKYILSIPEEK
jgi:hypothetical protein